MKCGTWESFGVTKQKRPRHCQEIPGFGSNTCGGLEAVCFGHKKKGVNNGGL